MRVGLLVTIVGAIAVASGCGPAERSDMEAELRSSLLGAWRITEVSVTSPDTTWTSKNPQPGLYIFSDRHFSNLLVSGTEDRTPFTDETTDEEELAAYQRFIGDAGTYEVSDTELTTHNIVAQDPNFMNGGFTYRYTVRGDSLVLTFNAGWAPAGGKITYRLVRLK